MYKQLSASSLIDASDFEKRHPARNLGHSAFRHYSRRRRSSHIVCVSVRVAIYRII